MATTEKATSNDNKDKETKTTPQEKATNRRLKTLLDTLAGLQAEEPVLTESELFSINSLVAYTAFERGVSEEVVRSMVETSFKVQRIEHIASKDYDDALRYLVDLNPKTQIN